MAGRGLDHLVIGVHDLDVAGAFYERLGFRVGARNRHPWGTHNRIVQFPGSFLELISVGEAGLIPEHGPGRFSFGAFVRDALTAGEGFSMLVLESTDAAADNATFRASGIGQFEPFFFERQASRPDGSTVRVAFTLAFAADPEAPALGFFVCQQHEPQNFWNREFQKHPNGALQLAEVRMAAPQPANHRRILDLFSGVAGLATPDGGLGYRLPRGRIEVVAAGTAPAFAGFAVTVTDLAAMRDRLKKAGIQSNDAPDGLVVPAAVAHGTTILIRAA